MNNKAVMAGVVALAIAGGLTAMFVMGQDTPDPPGLWKGEATDCGPGMSPAELDEALQLGTTFLLANQRPEGNFAYEWDWKKQVDSTGDNEVRQAGATWGLALILHDDPSRTDVRDALLRSLDFWKARAVVDPAPSEPDAPTDPASEEPAPDAPPRRRWVMYGTQRGSTGAVALLTLAHIELLRSGAELPEGRKEEVEEHLDQLLAMIRSQRSPEGGFHAFYQPDGTGFGKANPYADGECLLATVKAANHLGRSDLLPDAVRWARQDQVRNVQIPRAADPDPDTTKGYYQWVSMAWWELAHSEQAQAEPWGEWLMELAVWMIDEHRTLKRRRNTSYAYEGIVPAYAWAKEHGDPRADKFRCVIDQGLRKLTTWQLGHSLANDYVRKASPDDERGWGGIQNAKNEAPLRIDVTQHQMHAIILARRHYP